LDDVFGVQLAMITLYLWSIYVANWTPKTCTQVYARTEFQAAH